MLKYAVIPLLLLTLTSCFGGKKSARPSSSFAHLSDAAVHSTETGINEYYGCLSRGPIAVVNFDFDKSALSDKAKEVLKEAYSKCIHEHLINNPDTKLLITGHTDRHGTVEYNIALGSRRSDAVHRALHDISLNYHPTAGKDNMGDSEDSHKAPDMKTASCQTSKGKEEQLYDVHVPDADAKNRRAVLEFVDKAHCE